MIMLHHNLGKGKFKKVRRKGMQPETTETPSAVSKKQEEKIQDGR